MNDMNIIQLIIKSVSRYAKKALVLIKNFIYETEKLFPRNFSISEQIFFIKKLSFLMKADVPLLESITMVYEQTTIRRHKEILKRVMDRVANGQSLSNSLRDAKGIFNDFSINILSAGEEAGVLSENLAYLAEELQKKQALKRKIISACVYPVIVVCATVGIVLFLIVYLFPKIIPVFSSLQMKLPLSTRIVIAVSEGIRHYGFYIVGVGLLLLVICGIALKKYEKIKDIRDAGALRLPLFGKLIKSYNLANSIRIFSLLLKSGVPVGDALPITASISSNRFYKREFQNASLSVRRGETVSNSFRGNPTLFPDMVVQIVAVGERSGALPASLLYLSELYEAEVEDITKNLSSLVEPLLMIVMGLVVGFIAISIITPIYGITQNLHS
jgi:type IV pilus assembly protein PilC